jgi:hypothetical protein
MSAAKLSAVLVSYLNEVIIGDVEEGELVVDEGSLYVVGNHCTDRPSYLWVRDLVARRWMAVPDTRRVVVVMRVDLGSAEFVSGEGEE